MKTNTRNVSAERKTYTGGLWMSLAVLVLIVSGCATAAQPTSQPNQGEMSVIQDRPIITGTTEIIDVDMSAVERPPLKRAAAESCGDLSGPLLQVVESSDPVQTAQALGLQVREGMVQVSLVVDGDAAFLEQIGVQAGKQAGDRIQAFAPIHKLCELATHKRVLAIRPVSQAEIQ